MSSKFEIRIQSQESNSKFQVRFSVDRLTQSGNFKNLLELNQTLLPKDNLILMTCSTSVQIKKLWRSESICLNGPNRVNQLSFQTYKKIIGSSLMFIPF
jgi:hypothetical protein